MIVNCKDILDLFNKVFGMTLCGKEQTEAQVLQEEHDKLAKMEQEYKAKKAAKATAKDSRSTKVSKNKKSAKKAK